MPRFYDKKLSGYGQQELDEMKAYIADYENHARDKESKSAEDVEKYLWLGNAGALAVSGTFIQLAHATGNKILYFGIGLFLVGLLLLLILKFLSAYISSRDRYRFQCARMMFETDKETDLILSLDKIRDKTFHHLRKIYHIIVKIVGMLFIAGCVVTIIELAMAK